MDVKKYTSLIAVVVMSTIALTGAMSAHGRRDRFPASGENQRTPQGVWRTVVTPRNCQTGDAITSFPGLFTLNRGGTMAEYGIGPGASPALRSPGHGVWQREQGWQEYSFAFTYLRYNAGGMLLGSQRVTGTLELGADGDTFATHSVIEVLDVNDVVIGNACATAAGTRFQ